MSLDQGCFQRCLVSDAIILKPHRIGRNVQQVIVEKLRVSFEGVCSRHGYILPGSVQLHFASRGSLEGANLNGDVRYDLQYHALVCNPAIGSVLSARVVNMSRFGFLLHSGASPKGGDSVAPLSSIVETVVSRQASYTAEAPGSFVDLDTIQIGDVVNVRVMGKKFQLNDRHIFVVGRIVHGSPDLDPVIVPAIGDNNDEDLSVIAAAEVAADERDEQMLEKIQVDTDGDEDSSQIGGTSESSLEDDHDFVSSDSQSDSDSDGASDTDANRLESDLDGDIETGGNMVTHPASLAGDTDADAEDDDDNGDDDDDSDSNDDDDI